MYRYRKKCISTRKCRLYNLCVALPVQTHHFQLNITRRRRRRVCIPIFIIAKCYTHTHSGVRRRRRPYEEHIQTGLY